MKNKQSFTLIELLLYVAIVGFVLTSLVQFSLNVINGGTKSATQQEVYSNARFISERIKYEIRSAIGINQVTPTQISLITETPTTNPTVISYLSGNITIKQGVSAVKNLNSTNTTIPTFVFTNYSSADNKSKHIGIAYTINANFNSTRQEYQENLSVETSAEIRSN